MAGFFIPDPRFEMPALLEPGRKPVEPVEIDKNHYFGRIIKTAYLMQETSGDFTRDLVSGVSANLNNTFWVTNKILINSSSDNISVLDDDQLEGLDEYTILFKVSRNGNLTTGRSRILDKNGGVMAVGFTPTSFDVFQNGWRTTNYTMPINTDITSVITFKKGVIKKFINGVLIGSNSFVSDTGTGSGTFYIGNQDDSDSDFWPGYFETLIYSYSSIPDSLAINLTLNPYQFLIPA
jgi:hypothetical protein